MNVDDVYLVLHHHWVLDTSVFPDERQRLQVALLMSVACWALENESPCIQFPLTMARTGMQSNLLLALGLLFGLVVEVLGICGRFGVAFRPSCNVG